MIALIRISIVVALASTLFSWGILSDVKGSENPSLIVHLNYCEKPAVSTIKMR